MVSTLSATVSRLTIWRKPSLYSHSSLSRLVYPALHNHFNPISAHLSFFSKAQAINLSGIVEDLVVLGIETGCDDTGAAIVSIFNACGARFEAMVKFSAKLCLLRCSTNSESGDSQTLVSRCLCEHRLRDPSSLLQKLTQPVSPKYSHQKLFAFYALMDSFFLNFIKADLLARYGGVAPKMAEEAHAQVIDQIIPCCLIIWVREKHTSLLDFRAVGVRKARKLAGIFALPIIGVHHMEAHALVARLMERELKFPFMALLISGGHNLLILARDLGHYIQLGTTIDDAVGEAYDKTAKWLGLDLRKSGGPALEELAREGDPNSVKFKVPMNQHKDCNFSYAGLKTQVRLAIESKNIHAGIPISSASTEDRLARANIAASFQIIKILHLEEKCERAIEWALKIEPSIKHLVVSGGVASNQYVRARLDKIVGRTGLQLVSPPPSLRTDNGVMIAWTGIEHFQMGGYDPPPPACEPADALLDLRPRWPLEEELVEGRSEARSSRTARIHPSLTSLIQASVEQL
ncbi:probable tRNA N6-adenosine threonylcarbamoyltransferase, mitochondrial [Primulina eburnea]|uniref:probable tRNA N6-adenosine threonylcarbamoyltransferase, mitochondrial n=1 Tax=Primulina eburnea TaxID=1245227 RepID=UPI003C6C982A